jgi:hypothetical protein
MSEGSSDDAAGCIFWLAIIGLVVAILLALLAAYLSVLIGKFFSYTARAVIGWTLSRSSNKKYVALCTILALFVIPLATWLGLIIFGLSLGNELWKYAVIGYSTLGVIGYYAAHFGSLPSQFALLHAAGVMMIHEQEVAWRNSLRTRGIVFWHWTIARRAVEIDNWFRRAIGSLSGVVIG